MGVGDLVGVGVGDLVGVGVGVDGVQAVMSVVQAAPAAGQQYSVQLTPHVSILPVSLQVLSVVVPSPSTGWQLKSKLGSLA